IGQRMAAVLPNVRCLSGGPSKGKPPALNRAMAHARGDVIGVFDSDTRYEPDLLLRVAKYFHDHPDVSVVQAVPQVINRHTNAITRLTYYETRFWFQGLQAAKERFGLFMHLAGTGMFLRRSVLEALGPWDEACLTEDLEYSLRLAQSGVRVGFLGSQLLLTPLVLAETALTRDRKLLWLLPGLYWYWTLQLVALLRATFGVIVRPSALRWHRTPKLPSD